MICGSIPSRRRIPDKRQDEFQIRAAAGVRDHLRFIIDDHTHLREHMRESQRYGGKFLVGQECEVVLAAQKWGDVVRLARSLNRARTKGTANGLEVTALVCHERVEKQQE